MLPAMRCTALALLVAVTGCPAPQNPFVCADDCDGGGGSGGSAGGGTGGQGGGGGGSADAGCTEEWTCSAWDVSDAGTAARTCTDVNGCGTTAKKPTTGPAPLPALDLSYFQCEVQPVLERGCGMLGCHGTETDRAFRLYARGRLRHSEQVPQASTCLGGGMKDLAAEGTATVMCLGWSRLTASEWRLNFDNARAFGLGAATVADNELLTQPLAGNAKAHAGVKPFTLTDPAYLKLKAWLAGATAGPCDAGFN